MSDDPAAIVAATVNCKTMADNTLRLTVDIEPSDAKQAFMMFGERGTAVAIAVLTEGAAQADMQERVINPTHPYSRFASSLFAGNFFSIPAVRHHLQAKPEDTPGQVKELLKAHINRMSETKYGSLADIPPELIKQWAAKRQILFTFLETE